MPTKKTVIAGAGTDHQCAMESASASEKKEKEVEEDTVAYPKEYAIRDGSAKKTDLLLRSQNMHILSSQ